MSEMTRTTAAAMRRFDRQRGLSLIELMVAMTLGLLVSAGIVALFMATNQSNRTQSYLARVQENGRFATGRIEADLRMAGAMFRQSSVSDRDAWRQTANGALLPRAAIMVNATGFVLQDMGTETGRQAGWTTSEAYPLSAAYFIRGYECSTGTCNPTVPTGANGIPAVGTGAGNRVRGTDVLTMRYVRGIGWRYSLPPGVVTGYASVFTLDPASNAGTPLNFVNGDLALVSDCSNTPTIFRVNLSGASQLTPASGTLIQDTEFKPGASDAACDARIFNFTRDFTTVSYWLQLAADPNPSAAGRLIPTLMRAENGAAQEVAQGVERLDFLYGAAYLGNGGMAYLDATQVQANSNAANCSPPPAAFARVYTGPTSTWREPGCLWRSLRSIEAHALFNTVDDMGATPQQDTAYWYSIDGGTGPVIPATTMPVTALPVGRMMRREFMTVASIRNGSN
ncbi:MAG TPA: PilW family protein [Tahibacter sp.]|uniref:prepilin-type N-terminal cleavage/methylation domain-containing protein n=1 Tax=Tahibacter sp. TaxID=2056211 RepID=UPI002C1A31E2|nr:PilW family protein [Tahibacter sp.]HSX60400.1 PilW family protein [Tahibacter sp.]